ncbi:hypothetical protein CICLE_v10028678mg [Citrus x clementina]|uniref:Uncharacterized protein n=2 Tax=Citrus TaxID=2706 RepID=V4RRC9_CITCL|nr:hypothetical protein CICLE_v10028678mg [Citrus x clementina]
MGMMENTPSSISVAPLLLRNLATSIFIYADKSFLSLARKYKLLEIIRCILITFFLFILRLLASFLPSFFNSNSLYIYAPKKDNYVSASASPSADSGIARALSQLLSILNDIPVNSRKYQVVRSLAERLIDENHRDNIQALREVNRTVLSVAFSRTLGQLEAAVLELGGCGDGVVPVQCRLNRVLRAVLTRFGLGSDEVNRSGISADKLAAELLWLAEKLAACGYIDDAVGKWASASNLACLALSAEPRLQSSLVKISDFWAGHGETVSKAQGHWRPAKKRARNLRPRYQSSNSIEQADGLEKIGPQKSGRREN